MGGRPRERRGSATDLLELRTELLGTETCRTVGVEADVCIQVVEKSRVVLLKKMDIGQKAVNNRNAWSEEAGLLGRSERV